MVRPPTPARPDQIERLDEEEQSQLFTPASRSDALSAAFEDARAPPRLQILDRFANAVANPYAKYGLEQSCANKFSDPNFFLKEWLDDQVRPAGRGVVGGVIGVA